MVDVDVPDHVDITTELPGGGQGTYNFSSVSGLGPAPGAWLFGSKGTLHFDQPSNKLFGGKVGDKELREIASVEQLAAALCEIEELVAEAIDPPGGKARGTLDVGERLGQLDERLLRSERLVGQTWKIMMRDQLANIRAVRAARRA